MLLLLLFTIASASPTASVQPIDLTFVVPIIALIVIIFLAAVNMLATSISDPKLEAWAKTEIREFIVALILIGLILGFFISSNGISIALTGTTDYVGHSQTILDSWLGKFDDAYAGVILAAARVRVAATFAPYINVPLWYVSISYSTNPLAGIAIILTTLTMATQGLTNAIFLIEAVRMLIIYMKVVGPKILLPLAFMIRLIPFSRRLGNTLIALALAGMVLLPYSVIVADALNGTIPPAIMPAPHLSAGDLRSMIPEPLSLITSTVGPLCQSAFIRTMLGLTDPLFALVVCSPLLLIPFVGEGLFAACFPLVQYVIYPLITEILQLVMAALLLTWEAAIVARDAVASTNYGLDVYGTLQTFLMAINDLVLLIYLDIIIIMTFTVVGARSISTALGGEWYMAGIQRLV